MAVRVSERGELNVPAVTTHCAHCGEPVLVETDAHDLARACAAVVCSACTGTREGIVYIPSQPLSLRAVAQFEPPARQ